MNFETQVARFCKSPLSIFGPLTNNSRQKFVQLDVERQWVQVPGTISKQFLSISLIRINFRQLQLQLTHPLECGCMSFSTRNFRLLKSQPAATKVGQCQKKSRSNTSSAILTQKMSTISAGRKVGLHAGSWTISTGRTSNLQIIVSIDSTTGNSPNSGSRSSQNRLQPSSVTALSGDEWLNFGLGERWSHRANWVPVGITPTFSAHSEYVDQAAQPLI